MYASAKPSSSLMPHLNAWAVLSSPWKALLVLLFITVLTHLPSGFGSFVADDYLLWSMTEGSAELAAAGIEKANPDKSLTNSLKDAFHFYHYEEASLAAYQRYGNVPWWAGDDIAMVPFRPVAALTHWFDHRLFGDVL